VKKSVLYVGENSIYIGDVTYKYKKKKQKDDVMDGENLSKRVLS
jgi:hypothetical protein